MIAAIFSGRGRSGTSEIVGAAMNLLLGAVCLQCGLSGALTFVGTQTSLPFAILGGILVVLGGFRIFRVAARALGDRREAARGDAAYPSDSSDTQTPSAP